MPTGRVKFFNADRGFDFILPDDGGPDIFVHVHDVETAGMKTAPARDGRLKAVNLRLL
jgi:CspA family cold shock protein